MILARRMNPETTAQVTTELAKLTPPVVSIGTLTYFGYPISDIVQFLTGLYVICLLINMGWKAVKWARSKSAP